MVMPPTTNPQWPEDPGSDLEWAVRDIITLTPKDPTGKFYMTSRGRVPVDQYMRWLNSAQGRQWVNSYYLLLDSGGQDRVLDGYFPGSVPIAPYLSPADIEAEDWMSRLDPATQRRLLYQYGATDLSALDDAQKVQLAGMAKQIAQADDATKAANTGARFQSQLQDRISRASRERGIELDRAARQKQEDEATTYKATLEMRNRLSGARFAEAQQMAADDPEAYQQWLSTQGQPGEGEPTARAYTIGGVGYNPTGVAVDYGEYEATIGAGTTPRTTWYPGGQRTDVVVEEAGGEFTPNMTAFAAWYKTQPAYQKHKEALVQRYRETPYLAQQYVAESGKANIEGKTLPGFKEWVDLAPARKAQYEADMAEYRQGFRSSAYGRSLVSPRAKVLRY